MPQADLPKSASVVIIGGGVMGLSTAYQLAKRGVKNIVLLEKNNLGSGSTSKAAGGVRAQFSDPLNIQLGLRSLHAFETFAREFGQEIDLRQVGYLFLLDRPEHVDAFETSVALQNQLGVDSRMIDVAEAKRLSPMISTDGLLAAAWSPRDGHCTPESVVLGLATGARSFGVHIVRNCAVTGISRTGTSIQSVETPQGSIRTDAVVCCAGAWSQEIGDMAGVQLPVVPLRRQIVVTEPITNFDPHTPFTIDFATSFYFHSEGRGALMGVPDPQETPGFKLSRSDDWLPHLAEVIEHRAPRLADVGLSGGWAGLYEMTPDQNALLGESDEVSRFLYATGFSGHGFMMGPAIGEIMSDLYLGRDPFLDISGLDCARFTARAARPELNIV